MRVAYGVSPWMKRFPRSRLPTYPRCTTGLDPDVVIIGGGLTGCATAYAFAAAGIRVALLEAGRIGTGASGAAAGWLTDTPGPSFIDADAALGRRAARQAWQAWRKAALEFHALLRRLNVRCAAAPRGLLTVTRDDDHAALLAREQRMRSDAGLDATLLPGRSIPGITGFAASAALRTKESAALDPYRAALGLASAAAARGAAIFERSAVTATAFSRDDATVAVGRTVVRARRVIVATGEAGALFKPLARHFTQRVGYLVLTEPVPGRIRKTLGTRDMLLHDVGGPSHRISWVDDERLLVSGAEGDRVSERARPATLAQRTGQLMYELSTFYPDISGLQPAFGWDAPYSASAGGLPVVGPHRNYPHHLFALGAGQAVTGAYLASRILLRHYLDETLPSDGMFGFGR